MAKMGSKAQTDQLVKVLLILVLGVVFVGFLGFGPAAGLSVTAAPSEVTEDVPTTAPACKEGNLGTLNARIESSLADEQTFIAQDVSLWDGEGNFIATLTSPTNGDYDDTGDVNCGEYTYLTVETSGFCGSTGTISLDKGDDRNTIANAEIGTGTLRVWDPVDFSALSTFGDSNTSLYTVGASEDFDLEIQIDVTGDDTQYGCEQILLCVAYNDTEVEDVTVSGGNEVAVPDVASDAQDATGYDVACFELADKSITQPEQIVGYNVAFNVASGENPANDITMAIYDKTFFLAEDGTSIVSGYNDDTSGSADVGGSNPLVTVEIA